MNRSFERHFNRRSYYVVDEEIVTDDDVFDDEDPSQRIMTKNLGHRYSSSEDYFETRS